jgi:hypothetical protein
MIMDIDELLDGMRGVAADPRLEMMDAAVLAGVAVHRGRRAARRGLAVTGVLALGVGLAASVMSSPQGERPQQVAALNSLPSSAPSNLLLGMR